MDQRAIIRAECFDRFPSVVAGMSTRQGGISQPPLGMNVSFGVGDAEENVKRNRELFFGSLGISLEELAIPKQVHSSVVRTVGAPGSYAECDALVTNVRRVFLCVSVADCAPILLYDRKKEVVAGIHAGWRGTAGRIVERTIHVLRDEFQSSPENLIAFIGPCASVCCYSVGEEVAAQFDNAALHRIDGRVFLDLKEANRQQLAEGGVPRSAIEVSPLCTIGESMLLHSYRREKENSGRMFATIGLSV
jgi:YfiH family protein